MRIGVISPSQNQSARPERYVSKTAAAALVRRQLALRITKYLIQMVAVRDFAKASPYSAQKAKRGPTAYQHHIEPRIERLTSANSPWMAYLEGIYEIEA